MCYQQRMNWHEIIDKRSLELHELIVRELRADPSGLERVVAWIEKFLADPEYSTTGKDALNEWMTIIRTHGLPGVLAVMEDRGEEGRRLRQSSPFAVLMPQVERTRIFQKYEALRTRTHPAGV